MASDDNEEPEDAEGGAREPRQDREQRRDDPEDDGEDDGHPKNIFTRPAFIIGVIVVGVILLAGGVIWWLHARKFENTDDAFIDTHIVRISPQIAGQILALPVTDNQRVHRGDLLVAIDSADAEARLAQARAQEAQARTQLERAVAAEKGAAAQAGNARRDLARYRELQARSPNAVAQQQVDQAATASRNADSQRDAARAQVDGAAAQVKVIEAQIRAAEINLGYTRIVAPVDGYVTQRSAAAGNYVTPGQQLMAIVPLGLWVTANFKETQLERMRAGQKVAVKVDACGDETLAGHVDSIQRGAGQAFALLPPENATGNYVKVVQRVPVKIVLDRVPRDCPVGPGMSVVPRVRVR
jgi:membrane fusion protein (multidrug efflux system)